MAIYDYFISAFRYIIARFDGITIMTGVGLLSALALINIVYVMFVMFKRMAK